MSEAEELAGSPSLFFLSFRSPRRRSPTPHSCFRSFFLVVVRVFVQSSRMPSSTRPFLAPRGPSCRAGSDPGPCRRRHWAASLPKRLHRRDPRPSSRIAWASSPASTPAPSGTPEACSSSTQICPFISIRVAGVRKEAGHGILRLLLGAFFSCCVPLARLLVSYPVSQVRGATSALHFLVGRRSPLPYPGARACLSFTFKCTRTEQQQQPQQNNQKTRVCERSCHSQLLHAQRLLLACCLKFLLGSQPQSLNESTHLQRWGRSLRGILLLRLLVFPGGAAVVIRPAPFEHLRLGFRASCGLRKSPAQGGPCPSGRGPADHAGSGHRQAGALEIISRGIKHTRR